ncbi:hypothetical protein SNEBB_001325 [Seison nebaliae]|nr:hypothetical protein SNEBB_001325 [Seison nebaliae]
MPSSSSDYSTTRYVFVIFFQMILLFADVFINSFGEYIACIQMTPQKADNVFVVLYIIQDLFILLNVISIFLLLNNTFSAQAGLLFRSFKAHTLTLVLFAIYFILTFLFQIVTLSARYGKTEYIDRVIYDRVTYLSLYIIHRLFSIVYFHTFKRLAFILNDPKEYMESDWVKRHFEKRMQRTIKEDH